MANQANTQLNIKVNARELGTLEATLKRVFGKDHTAAFLGNMKNSSKFLKQNVAILTALNEQLTKLDSNAEAFDKLIARMDRAKEHAKALREEMGGMFGGGGAGGGGGSRAGKRRDAVSSLARAQVPMLNMEGLQQVLGAFPVFGQIASGSLAAAAQSYGSYLSYEQSQLNAAPYLINARSALGYRRSMISPGSAGHMVGPDVAAARQQGLEKISPGILGAINDITPGGMALGAIDSIFGTNYQADARAAIEKFGAKNSIGKAIAQGVTEGLGAIPGSGAEAAYAKAAGRQWQPGTSAVYTAKPMNPKDFMHAGISMGFMPQQAIEMAGQLSGAAGRPAGSDEFKQALALERLFGVGVAQTGAAQRGMRRTGGSGDMQQVADMIGASIQMGLESSAIQEELEKQTSFLEEQANKGVKFDSRSMSTLALTLFGASSGAVSAERAGDIARQFAGGAAAVGFQGPQRAVDIRMMRALGYTGKGGAGEFAKYSLMMQNPEMTASAMPAYLKQFEQPGMNQDLQALLIQKALGAYGVQVGAGEAMGMVGLSGKGGVNVEGMNLEDLISAAKARSGALGGATIAEGWLEDQRIGIGGKISKSMIELSEVTNNLASTFMNQLGGALEKVTEALDNFTAGLAAAGPILGVL